MKNLIKTKLKRRGLELYNKYFYNPDHVINEILIQIDDDETINEAICETVFNVSEKYMPQIYELILYYPKKLKEIKYITDNIIDGLYLKYGETINIMNESKTKTRFNVRGKLASAAQFRARQYNIPCNINSEDIMLIRTCPLLNVPIEYGNTKPTNNSASLDRIIPSLGYTKDNVQVISHLANQMKSNANREELITFAESILKMYQK